MYEKTVYEEQKGGEMFSRKDYKKIAGILSDAEDSMYQHVYRQLVYNFAVMFKEENPRFGIDTFYNACNLIRLEFEIV